MNLKATIYKENDSGMLVLDEIKEYLQCIFPAMEINIKELILNKIDDELLTSMANRFADIKIRDPLQKNEPENKNILPAELDFEKRRLSGKTRAIGYIYDGYRYSNIFRKYSAEKFKKANDINIIVTNQLLSTRESIDDRYHLRVIIFSLPVVFSVTGLFEAPAKPREYYVLKQSTSSMGMNNFAEDYLLNAFENRYLRENDERTTDIAKGYFVQAIFYTLIGDPFCENKNCRLFNAHWQEDMIHAQLSKPDFCNYHQDMIKEINLKWSLN